MSMMKEFREFAVKGNVIDMAVGIIIGGAFGKIVASLVNDVVLPVVGQALGGVSFKELFINLSDTAYATLAEAQEAGAATLNYGIFLQNILDFVIIAFVIFMMVKAINNAKRKEEEKPAAPAAPPEEVVLLREIRDSLARSG
ncbi:MAG: large conductance mechanosensitive channel protein MscL [Thermoanaerobaculia bacterium]|nr:large conductance mechanosensitive channel protein MscL [Thermoanaerobaculia bacterium]